MISILLYGSSLLLLIATGISIGRKLVFRWQKFCLIGISCLLLISAVYHTACYDKPVYKIEIDQEGYYYPKEVSKTYEKLVHNLNKIEILIRSIVFFRKNNVLYPLIYWNIKDVFGPRYFLEGFFFVCILNCILFLFSVCFFFNILSHFKVSKYFLWLCSFIFFQPFVIARNALPLANSLTIFSLVLFFYTMIFQKQFF